MLALKPGVTRPRAKECHSPQRLEESGDRCSAQPPEGAQPADTLTVAHWGTHLSELWENTLVSF